MPKSVSVGTPEEPSESIVNRAIRKLIKSYPDQAPIDALADRTVFTKEEYLAWLNSFNQEQQEKLEYDWNFRARPKQRTPAGEWKNWLIIAGRGWG